MNTINKNRLLSGLVCMFFMLMNITQVQADDKIKAKIGVDYFKVMNDRSYISVEVKYKFEKKYQGAEGLSLNVYQNFSDDSLISMGSIITDAGGIAIYEIDNSKINRDSVLTYKYTISIENDELLKDASKTVKFKDCNIMAEAIEIDSVHHISIRFTDAVGNAIEDEDVEIALQRLFAPLKIGESSYSTDENGEVLIPIEKPLPGIDGILTFIVTHDSRSYGNVKNIFDAPIGQVIVDQSTFDKRTMWAPARNTPIFLLIFPNLLIFGIWGVIALLVFNIYKIFKA